MADAKRKEAMKAMEAGAKHEKTSLTKWKPDFESALAEYERAAIAFKTCKDHARAADAFAKAAAASHRIDAVANAGRLLETGAQMLRDGGDADGAAAMFERSARMYFEEGSVEKGAEALCKGARALEESSAERAAQLYVRAAQAVHDDESRPVELSVPTYRAAVSFLLRAARYADAVRVLEQQLDAHYVLRQPEWAAKCALTVVVARLCADDFLGAHGWLSALEADTARTDVVRQLEVQLARAVLDTFQAQSEEALAAEVGKRAFNYLDPQAVKLARGLRLQVAGVPVEYVTSGSAGARGGPGAAGGAARPLPPPPPPPSSGLDDAGAGPLGSAAPGSSSGARNIKTGDFGEVIEEFTDDLT